MTDRRCPRCSYEMVRVDAGEAVIDKCRFCHGTYFDAGEAGDVLGQGAEAQTWKELWITSHAEPSELRCPHDHERMAVHRLRFEGQRVEVDHCDRCGGLWLDRNEGELLAKIARGAVEKQERKRAGEDKPGILSYLFQLATHLPVEVWHPVRRRPLIVYALLAVLPAVFVLQLLLADHIAADRGVWMMIPREVISGIHRHTVLTNGFMHGGLTHILGNLYFLWLFGDNVEDTLGWRRFSAVYLLSLLAGSLSHLFAFSSSGIPVLGASGAIAGVMGAYMVLFPRVRVWIVVLLFRFRIRARWYLGFWVGFQVLMQATGSQGVAWLAHIGGFIVGAAIALFLRDNQSGPAPSAPP